MEKEARYNAYMFMYMYMLGHKIRSHMYDEIEHVFKVCMVIDKLLSSPFVLCVNCSK